MLPLVQIPEIGVGLRAGLAHLREGLSDREVVLAHEEGSHDACRPAFALFGVVGLFEL
jgi:hypothetical protein